MKPIRVKFTKELTDQMPTLKGKAATVVGLARKNPDCLIVLTDGQKYNESVNIRFLRQIYERAK
jgi:hypothetical protein